jgi:hypothetical protein
VVSAVVLDDGEGYYSFVWNHDDMGDQRQILYEFEGPAAALELGPDGTAFVVDGDGVVHIGGGTTPWQTEKVSRRGLTCVRLVEGQLFVAGRGGVFERSAGGWQTLGHPTGAPLNDIDGASVGQLYVVGQRGSVRRHGDSWIDLGLPSNVALVSVRVLRLDDILIGGHKGTLYRGNGVQWQPVSIGELSVYAIASYRGEIHLACADRGVWKLAGDAVQPVREDIPAFSMAAAGTYLAVGGREYLWRFDGQTWEYRRYAHVP